MRALRALDVLDTPPEDRFDRITRMAGRIFEVPIALVSLVDQDRQWFKSKQGLEAPEYPRDISFCGHTILDDRCLVVEDPLLDLRFRDNPLVTGDPKIRFYAGQPILTRSGHALGTLCLIDRQPRRFPRDDAELLRDLADMVEDELAALEMASCDSLTGLAKRSMALCDRERRPATLLTFDLDGFKAINDQLGHTAGDEALVMFGGLLSLTFRASDVVARLGGDVFSVLMTGADTRGARHALERLAQAARSANQRSEQAFELRYGVGVSERAVGQPVSLEDLVRDSTERMDAHKKSRGRPAA